MTRGQRASIAIITDGMTRSDAVSTSVVDTWRFLSENPEWEVSVLTRLNELHDVPATIVDGLSGLLLAREFLSADLLIYHYCFAAEVCHSLIVGNGRARQAVFFHGITPPALALPRNRYETAKSFTQLYDLHHADRLWPVSATNAEFLIEGGFDPGKIDIIPLALDRPPLMRLADKAAGPVELLFVGRILPHKGVHELIEAVALLRGRDLPPFHLKVAGGVEDNARTYFDSLRQAIAKHRLGDVIEFVGLLDEDGRDRLLRGAHILPIPSYHEGFCKPVIEALRAGCVPIGYASHNLRFIADGLCRMVAPGDVGALAAALAEVIADVGPAIRDPKAQLRLDRADLTADEFTVAAFSHVEQFAADRIALLMRQHAARLLEAMPAATIGAGVTEGAVVDGG